MSGTEKLFEKAKEAFSKRNYDYAIELFLNILKVDPNHVDARKALRNTELKKQSELGGGSKLGGLFGAAKGATLSAKNPEKTLDKAEAILKNDPKNIKVRYTLAQCLIALGHHAGAAVELEGSLEVDPDHVESMKLLCEAYQHLGRIRDAQNIIQRATKKAPSDGDAARMLRAVMASQAIEDTQAESAKDYRDMIRDKDQAAKLEAAGRLVGDAGEMADDEQALLANVQADPSDIKSLKKLGELYNKSRQYKKAMEVYTKAYEVDTSDGALRMAAGDARVKLYDQYIAKYAKAVQGGDDSGKEKLKKYRLDKLRFQIQEWEQRVREHPTDMNLRFQLGTFYLTGNKVDQAIEQFQATIKDPKRKVVSMQNLGSCFRKKGLYDLAAGQLNKALDSGELASDEVNGVRYELGRTFEEGGQLEKALDEYKRVMEVDINFKDVMKRIENLKAKLGA
jgi:tetratricopeptide (TPR) repeat protein